MDCVHFFTVVTSWLFSPKGNVTLTQTFPLIISKEQTRCLFEHRSLFAHVSVLNLRFEPHHPRKQRRGNFYGGRGWGAFRLLIQLSRWGGGDTVWMTKQPDLCFCFVSASEL